MDSPIRISRKVVLPDRIKIERYLKVPELGPKILFFSGGTALKDLSSQLINFTHNSIHLITPFDSGGSSAKIRDAFNMLAVGDLRNRLMALADKSVKGNPDIYELFAYRLPEEGERKVLIQILYEMLWDEHPLIAIIRNPMKKLILNNIKYFIENMPSSFDLRGANIGNIILTGGYINNHHEIDTVLYLFSRLVEVRGIVRPTLEDLYHLVAELEDGRVIVGQHLITGKESQPISSPIKRIFISKLGSIDQESKVKISTTIESHITKSDLICYPMGSFFSSVIANLIPVGVGEAVASNDCPKVYIPNSTHDPEQISMSLLNSVHWILDTLRKGNQDIKNEDLLNFIILDTQNGHYPYSLNLEEIKNLGIGIIDTNLITKSSAPYINSDLLIRVLLSLT